MILKYQSSEDKSQTPNLYQNELFGQRIYQSINIYQKFQEKLRDIQQNYNNCFLSFNLNALQYLFIYHLFSHLPQIYIFKTHFFISDFLQSHNLIMSTEPSPIKPMVSSQNQNHHFVQEMVPLNTQGDRIQDHQPLTAQFQNQDEESIISIKEAKSEEFYPYYVGQQEFYFTRLWFWHMFKYCWALKTRVVDKGRKVAMKHIPRYAEDEDITSTLQQAKRELNAVQNEKRKMITRWDLFSTIFFGDLRIWVIRSSLTFLLQSVGKCSLSIIISILIQNIRDGEISDAYEMAVIYLVVQLISMLGQHHGYTQAMIFSSKARMTLVNLVYEKLTELSGFSIKEASIGKILNLVSGDINALEHLFITMFQSSVLPITFGYASAILWLRFGPIGMLAIGLQFLSMPNQIVLQSFNSNTIKEAKKNADQRLKLTNELVEGIRLIKMYAWEDAFRKMLGIFRNHEVKGYLVAQFRNTFDRLFTLTSHFWGSIAFFLIIYYGGAVEDLSVPDLIATMQLMSYLRFSCVFMFSLAVQAIIMIRISFERIATILNISNAEMTCIEPLENEEITNCAIQLDHFSAFWKREVKVSDLPVLKNLSMKVNYGELWAVVGKVGSGKSTLLSVFLNEIPAYKGSIRIHGEIPTKVKDLKIAYVEQEPFIFPDSIRKNVLFGRPYNSSLYKRVLQVSCLEHDLHQMKFQDFTEIGERGVTLSGGQKARLSLARALYQLADVYLFDDPLSAVDAHVAKSIFHFALKKFIFQEQPRLQPDRKMPVAILVTHQVQYAIECDKILILNNGEMVSQGTYEKVKGNLTMINEELAQQLDKAKEKNKAEEFKEPEGVKRQKIKMAEIHNLIGREEDQSQLITNVTYKRYFSYWPSISIFFVIILTLGCEAYSNLYLRFLSTYDDFKRRNEQDTAWLILSLFIIGLLLNNAIKYLIHTSAAQGAASEIHNDMLQSLSLAPVSYFDTNPSGRIINRFSNDLYQGDMQTNALLLDIEEIITQFGVALVTMTIIVPYCGFFIILVLVFDIYFFRFSKSIISQLKEVELMQRSPLFDFLKKTLGGVIQVKVYKQEEWFRKQFLQIANRCNITSLTYYYATRSFGFNIEMVGYLVQVIGVFIIIELSANDFSRFSQALFLLSTFNESLQWGLRQMITFETQMNSYNRMFQIIDIPPEAAHHLSTDDKEFPREGSLHLDNVHMRYRQETELVLKGLTFKVKSGEKIGCVGRTGAGKSSILQVLYRMAEIESDQVSTLEISNQDIRKLGLTKLRSSIGIIPQQPFLFTGTIRRNLDPFDEYKDEQLWQVLEETDLKSHVKGLKEGLNSDMSDVNSVFSVGQKQLICLARTILNKKRIMVLDEATANVDMKTDDFIQKTLKEKFPDTTLITIAHRLNTIADYDKVMVISEGKAVEFDTPFNLLAQSVESEMVDRNTQFAQLVRNTGPENSQAIFKVAKTKFKQQN